MKQIKTSLLTALSLLFIVVWNFSCKKELNPPVANAGADQTITLPTNMIMLDGSASTDPDNNIASYAWSKIAGPSSYNFTNTNVVQVQVTNLVKGDYKFELTVTDATRLIDRDTIQVTVNDRTVKRPPVANAGPDQTITLPTNTVTLDGSASTDPDNNISSYAWSKIAGPPCFFTNPNLMQVQMTNLEKGDYRFELKVTDADGLTNKDTMQVTVNDTSLVDIYVAGDVNGFPVYWKNGQMILLDNEYYTATSIAVAGTEVSVAGTRNELIYFDYAAKYWKNGQGIQLGNYAGANSIAVVGSDVYVAGYEWENIGYSVAKYWKNGQAVPLTNGSMEAYANSIAVVDNDIYVAGYEGFPDHEVAKYWKNGQAISLTNGTNQAYANSITVVGNDIYVAGSESSGSGHVAKYWKNGQEVLLANGIGPSYATSITVVGGDVYVAGYQGDYYTYKAKYWKNGQAVLLTNGTNPELAYSITVVNNDVYVAGGGEGSNNNTVAKYWKNGQPVQLTNGLNSGSASSIVVVKR